MEQSPLKKTQMEEIDSALLKVRQALGKIHYGAIEIIIHDSKVVQIEAREKIRLTNKPNQTAGGTEAQ